MKKQVFNFCFFALPALLLGGCENDSGPDSTDGSLVPIEITDSGIGASLEGIVSSRATTTITGGSMGVFRTTANGYEAQYNSQYSYNGGWKAETGASPILVGAENATLCACYPYDAAPYAANSFVCTLTAQKWAADKDLCYATTGGDAVCNQTPTVSFSMTRAYSRITLNIQRGDTYSGNCSITNVNLKNSTGNDFFDSRTLDISNGMYGGSATPGGWNHDPNIASIAAGATNTACDVLVPPQPVTGGLTITLTVDGANQAVTIPSGKFTGNALAAGQQYIIYLLFTSTTLTLSSSVTEQGWSATPTDVGTVTDASAMN